jgi:hypothetical protein
MMYFFRFETSEFKDGMKVETAPSVSKFRNYNESLFNYLGSLYICNVMLYYIVYNVMSAKQYLKQIFDWHQDKVLASINFKAFP